MGLFSKLFGRSGNSMPENELTVQSTNSETSLSIISRAIAERECSLSKAIRIPYTEAMLTRGSLMQLAPSCKLQKMLCILFNLRQTACRLTTPEGLCGGFGAGPEFTS